MEGKTERIEFEIEGIKVFAEYNGYAWSIKFETSFMDDYMQLAGYKFSIDIKPLHEDLGPAPDLDDLDAADTCVEKSRKVLVEHVHKIAELRPVTHAECRGFHQSTTTKGFLMKPILMADGVEVSISSEDRKNGSPKSGDMIARNPENHEDQWLVNEQYFNDNFEPL